MTPTSPMVARWELSIRLRRRAEEVGVDVGSITRELGFSRNYWSAVINDRAILTAEKLEIVGKVLDLDQAEVRQLLDLRELAKERSWLNRYAGVIPNEDVMRYYGLEAGAERVEAWESMLVTGLLQTEDYARAVIRSDPNVTATKAEQLIKVRLLRQERLRAEKPLQLRAVMSEAALWQQTGGAEVLHDQLHYLARAAAELWATVEMRIVPFTATTLGSLGGSTRFFFHFSSPRLPMLAWLEQANTTEKVEESEEAFEQLNISNERALDMSLSREDSLALIKERAAALD